MYVVLKQNTLWLLGCIPQFPMLVIHYVYCISLPLRSYIHPCMVTMTLCMYHNNVKYSLARWAYSCNDTLWADHLVQFMVWISMIMGRKKLYECIQTFSVIGFMPRNELVRLVHIINQDWCHYKNIIIRNYHFTK